MSVTNDCLLSVGFVSFWGASDFDMIGISGKNLDSY